MSYYRFVSPTQVVRGSGISKTLKTKLFSEKVLKQLCELYKWEGPGGWKGKGAAKKGIDVEVRFEEILFKVKQNILRNLFEKNI